MFFRDGALCLVWAVLTRGDEIRRGLKLCRDDCAVRVLVTREHRPAFRDEFADVLGDRRVADAGGFTIRVKIVGFSLLAREVICNDFFCHLILCFYFFIL